LDRLREEEAIEARGGDGKTSDTEPTQAVFDLSAGEFTDGAANGDARDTGSSADSEETDANSEGTDADGDRTEADATSESAPDAGVDPATEAVVSELTETDVAETSPLELMATVQEWQERLE
jgi:DNA mismatch repair protein MutS